MASSLSNISLCSHAQLHFHPKQFRLFFQASQPKPSPHSTQSNSSLSLKPSQNPKELLRKSLVDSVTKQAQKLDITLCAHIVKCLYRAGKPDRAARLIASLESHRPKTEKMVLYNAFIGFMSLHFKQIIFALETVGRMRANGCRPDTTTCSLLVIGLCNRGLIDLAFEIVEHFKTVYDVCPSLKARNELLEGTIVIKGPKEGLKLLDEMESDRFRPDETTFSSVVRAVCKRGNLDEIQVILDGVTDCGFELDIAALCALVKIWIENRDFGKVGKVIDEMLVKASNAQRYSMVAMLCEEGLVDKARTMVEWLLKNRSIKLKLCNPVIDTFIKAGHPNKARDFIDEIVSVCGLSNTAIYNTILYGICKRGHVTHALEMLEKLVKMGGSPDLITYNILIGAHWNIGNHAGSVEMVSQLLEKGFKPDEVTNATLIMCLCQDGMIDEAKEIKRVMKEKGHRVGKSVYDMMLLGFCKAGKVNEVIDLLDEMLENECEVNCKSVGNILEGLAYGGYENEARKITEEIVLRNLVSPVDLLDHCLG